MATEAQLAKKIQRSLELGKRHHFATQRVAEKEILKLYREAAGRTANIMMSIQTEFITPTTLTGATKRIGIILDRLATKTTRIIQKHGIDSVKLGLRDTIISMRIYARGLKQIYHPEIIRTTFQKIQQTTIRAFLTPLDGIKLSDRIWDLHQTSLQKIKRAIARGYLQGKFPNQIANDIKRFLVIPDADMRKKYWKQFFRENPPGRGVYRSAYKNTQRVLRTESNRAYRMGQSSYAKNRKWIKGLKWTRVSGAIECPECDTYAAQDLYGLGDGVYIPEGIPSSHPLCLCFLINIPHADVFNPEKLEKVTV